MQYLLVGGAAAQAYGAMRTTKDSDCLVGQDDENLHRLAGALQELRARLRVSGLTDEESAALPIHIEGILRQGDFSTWRTDAGDLDILKTLPGPAGPRRYEDLTSDARILHHAGVRVRVASLTAIIASKELAGRPKDQDALPELHHLQQQQRRGTPPQPAEGGPSA